MAIEIEEQEMLCGCGKNPQTKELHTCPFMEEIHNDSITMCRCCDECKQNCCDDI